MPTRASEAGADSHAFTIREFFVESDWQKYWLTGYVDIDELECLQQIAAHGIHTPQLCRIRSQDRSRLLNYVQVLMPPHGSSSSLCGVSAVAVSSRVPWESTRAVLSALACSQTVHRVNLDCGGDDELWRWVGYAIFSRESRAYRSVWNLPVDFRMPVEVIEIIRQVVEAADRLAALMGEDRDPQTDDVLVSANRFFFTAPSAGATHPSIPDFTSANMLVVPAIKKVLDGYSVLLPGHGKAWVRGADVEKVEMKPTSSLSDGAILEVSSKYVPLRQMKSVVAFLGLVGNRLSSLKLDRIAGLPDVWLRKIVHACLLLEELTLKRTDPKGLSGLVESPTIRKLAINILVEKRKDMNRVARFFKALSCTEYPLSKSLEELTLEFSSSIAFSGTFLALMRKLLDRNNRLHRLCLDVSVNYSTYHAKTQVHDKFRELTGVTKHWRTRQLG